MPVVGHDGDDVGVIARCLSGDRRAFGELVEKYKHVVYNIALRMSGTPEDAEDVSQTVFLKAYENLAKFNPEYKFFSWIYRMTVNQSINFRSRKRPDELLDSEYISSEPTPEEHFVADKKSKCVMSALATLSQDYRAVIVLRHFEDLSYEEIADCLEIPLKKVKSRLFSARQILAIALQEQGVVGHA